MAESSVVAQRRLPSLPRAAAQTAPRSGGAVEQVVPGDAPRSLRDIVNVETCADQAGNADASFVVSMAGFGANLTPGVGGDLVDGVRTR